MIININHIFLLFMGVVGAAVGLVLVVVPQSADYRLPPYFWVLIAMASFELIAFVRGHGAPGMVLAMEARIAGFILAIVLMILIPIIFGSPARLF